MTRPLGRRRHITAIGSCWATGKTAYHRRDAAYLARLNRRRDHEPWAEFRCPDCGHYHLGHSTKRRRRRLR